MDEIDWRSVDDVLALPIAADWAKPFYRRVAIARGHHIYKEATRATIEALTRELRSRKWTLTHASKDKRDGRADSRYYRSPSNHQYVVRISNHGHPAGVYAGAKDYVVDAAMMAEFNVLGLINMIERDVRDCDPRLRPSRQNRK
jgi:hypothetical protein